MKLPRSSVQQNKRTSRRTIFVLLSCKQLRDAVPAKTVIFVVRLSTIVVALLTCCLATPALAQSTIMARMLELRLQNRLIAGSIRPDGELVRKPGLSEYLLQNHFRGNTEPSHPGAFLSVTTDRLYGLRKYELSRLDCALRGGDLGATLGLFVGAVGYATGAWDERSSWYLVGTMSALGAMWGGFVGADDPQWRVRYSWEPEQP